MPIKRTAAAKKVAAKKTPAKKGAAKRGRPASKTAAKKSPAKKSPAKKAAVKNVKKPASKRGGFHRPLNEDTGFVVDTDSDLIAQALIEGGESRQEIIDYLREEILESETRTGEQKAVANMVSGVLNKLLSRGFTVESSFRVVPPAKRPAKKAAAKKGRK